MLGENSYSQGLGKNSFFVELSPLYCAFVAFPSVPYIDGEGMDNFVFWLNNSGRTFIV